MNGKKRTNILVTGAKGFVGSAVVNRLECEYVQVFTVGNSVNLKNQNSFGKKKETLQTDFSIDITDREKVLGLEKIGSVDVVIHAAGLAHQFGTVSRENFQKVNVEGTANILELALKLRAKHFILISSVSVYGDAKNQSGNVAQQGIDETSACLPNDFYAESKLAGEKIALAFCAKNNMKLTILRLATVIGEGDKGNFLRLIRQIDRRHFIWIGKGENHKSFVHREDVAHACALLIDKNETDAEIFNISADFLSMRRIVEIVSDKLNKKIPNFFIPTSLIKIFFRLNTAVFRFVKIQQLEKTVYKWLAEDIYSAEKIKHRYGFVPQITAQNAVEREVKWYRQISSRE